MATYIVSRIDAPSWVTLPMTWDDSPADLAAHIACTNRAPVDTWSRPAGFGNATNAIGSLGSGRVWATLTPIPAAN